MDMNQHPVISHKAVVAVAAGLLGLLLASPAPADTPKQGANPTMRAANPVPAAAKAPVFVNLTSGKDALHAASMGLGIARSAVKAGRTTVVFLNVHAAAFAAAELPASLKFEDFDPVRTLLAETVAGGGKVFVCEHCAHVMKLDTGKLLPGIVASGHGAILDAVPPHAICFSY